MALPSLTLRARSTRSPRVRAWLLLCGVLSLASLGIWPLFKDALGASLALADMPPEPWEVMRWYLTLTHPLLLLLSAASAWTAFALGRMRTAACVAALSLPGSLYLLYAALAFGIAMTTRG